MDDLRQACAAVAAQARHVRVVDSAVPACAASLAPELLPGATDPPAPVTDREATAAYWLTMDAINFGSGWFPTLRKRPGLSGYNTIAAALQDRFTAEGPWSAAQLTELDAPAVAGVLGQELGHELMALYAASLNDLGRHVQADYGGAFAAVVDSAGGSAVALAGTLGQWDSFRDCSTYGALRVPFRKRAQIAAADLHRAGVADFADLGRLTMFADNLVPHVLRLDGVLWFDPELVQRIDRGELIVHSSPEEVEIRACALHAVELLVAERPGSTAAETDQFLWLRGGEPGYKARPRHRSRTTAY